MGAFTVRVDGSGRLVIPRDLRDQLGIPDGGELQLSVQDGELHGATRLAAFQRLRRKLARPGLAEPDPAPIEGLLADRRAEATAEDAAEQAWAATRRK